MDNQVHTWLEPRFFPLNKPKFENDICDGLNRGGWLASVGPSKVLQLPELKERPRNLWQWFHQNSVAAVELLVPIIPKSSLTILSALHSQHCLFQLLRAWCGCWIILRRRKRRKNTRLPQSSDFTRGIFLSDYRDYPDGQTRLYNLLRWCVESSCLGQPGTLCLHRYLAWRSETWCGEEHTDLALFYCYCAAMVHGLLLDETDPIFSLLCNYDLWDSQGC